MRLVAWKNDIFKLELIPANCLATLGVITSMCLRTKARLFETTERLVGLCNALTAGLTLERELESIKTQLTKTSVALDLERVHSREKDHKLRMALAEVKKLQTNQKNFKWYRLSLAAWRQTAKRRHLRKLDVQRGRIGQLKLIIDKYKLELSAQQAAESSDGSDYDTTDESSSDYEEVELDATGELVVPKAPKQPRPIPEENAAVADGAEGLGVLQIKKKAIAA